MGSAEHFVLPLKNLLFKDSILKGFVASTSTDSFLDAINPFKMSSKERKKSTKSSGIPSPFWSQVFCPKHHSQHTCLLWKGFGGAGDGRGWASHARLGVEVVSALVSHELKYI